jgi:hypothetical protein
MPNDPQDKYRVGRKLGTTIYKDNEMQPCAIVMSKSVRSARALARRIVLLLNRHGIVDLVGCGIVVKRGKR